MKRGLIAIVSVVGLVLTGCSSDQGEGTAGPNNSTSANPTASGTPTVKDVIASGLEAPWGMAFLPDDTAIITERDTAKVLIVNDGQTSVIGTINEARPEGEGGLLGVAVSPTFNADDTLFLYFTTASDNRVASATLRDGRLSNIRPILTGIPAGFTHNGGRMTFGPDGYLYIGTGDAGNGQLAQSFGSLGGKILRITKDGKAAPGNPRSGSPVWSLGHRNVQGLAFDDAEQLWASEFGQSRSDELNKIQKGGNYGWPAVEGKGDNSNYINPQLTWPVSKASPSGLAFADGHLWMASLRGERLWRISLNDRQAVDPADFLIQDYGRLRTVNAAPDGQLWVTTSNRDGRGSPANDDDRILSVTTGIP